MGKSKRSVVGILLGLGIALCICIGVAFFLTFFIDSEPFSGVESPLKTGEAAPDFSLPSLNEQEIHLEDLRGKPILLNFWASWCDTCVAEMPLLESTAQKYENLLVIGVNVGDTPAKVKNFVSAEHLSFTILLDEDGKISEDYTITGYPTSIFIDKAGIIQFVILGELNAVELAENLALIGIE